METFSFYAPEDLSGERKSLSAVIFFQATNSVFIITDENSTFSNTTTRYCFNLGSVGTVKGLHNLL